MSWSIKRNDELLIIKCEGRLDAKVAQSFKEEIKNNISQGAKNTVVNLSNVSFIDSSGLGSLVACLRAANEQEGDVKLCGLNPEIKMIFEITKLYQVFDIFQNEDTAIHSFI